MTRAIPVSILFALGLAAEDWPEFRGPGGQGHSASKRVPAEWSETSNIRWKADLPGKGWSSPSVRDGKVWVTSATDGGKSLRLLAFDAGSGKPLRDIEVFRLDDPKKMHAKNSHASPTPLVDGNRVYVHFGAHGTACVRTDGKILWKTKLEYDHRHGTGGSPALVGNLLVFNCDGYDSQYVVALDRRTGEVRWKSPRKGYQAYTTPLLIRVDGQDQIMSVGAHRAVAYDPETGAEIWSVRYAKGYSNVPRPVFGHGMVFISAGFDEPLFLAVRTGGKGDVTDTHIAWSLKKGAPLTPSPLLIGDEIYLISDNGIASCLDARTGTRHWQERIGGNHSASPIFAGGRIYFLSEEGESVAVQPGKEFKKLGANQLDGRFLASMAVTDGALFLRAEKHLYRIGK